jgi:hypothetical protein
MREYVTAVTIARSLGLSVIILTKDREDHDDDEQQYDSKGCDASASDSGYATGLKR